VVGWQAYYIWEGKEWDQGGAEDGTGQD